MTDDDRLDDGQAKARAAVLGGKEGIQQTGQGGLIKTRPGILKLQTHAARPIALLRLQASADPYDARPAHGLLAVNQNIVKGPIQQILVPAHTQAGLHLALHADVMATQFPFQKGQSLITRFWRGCRGRA